MEALRNTLEEDKPCPVCGNTVHPYADPGKHLKEEQSLLEKEYDLCCNQYDELMQNEARIRESLSHYALELDKANQDIPGIEKLYLDNTQKWKELKLPAKIHSAPEDEVFSAIEEMKQELRKESGELEKAVDRMNFLRKETERLRQDLEISVEKTGKLEKQVTESLHFIALLEKETKHREERIKEHEKEYSENTDRVDLWFAQPGWMENWKENQDLFVTRIREFAAAWNLKFKKLEETLQKKEISEKTLSLLESQFKETMNNFDAAMKRLEIQQQSIQELQSQRKAIFSGLAVETVEKMLNEKVTSGKKNCDAIHQKYLESLSDKNKNAGILKQIQDDLKNQTKRFEAAKAELDEWLDTFNRKKNQNISIPLLRDLLSKSVEWIDAEKKEVREWKDAVLRATTTLQERREQLKRLIQEQKEAPDKELAKKTLIGLEELKERLSAEKTGITFRLREDENNRITAGKLLADLENKLEVSEKWQKLNELLGSADGKKFRQIAQEYTLEILLGYANVQLRNLSGRYSLGVVPGTLALQVTDHDMGDEIRSVHSLSGGESFLISLALALGLASLSSGKMNVESLFIDEGFGSLDPQTLNIAMDALEQLHNQGRKVGVISHVQDMTERIQTKIHLKKIAGGKSKVLIYNT